MSFFGNTFKETRSALWGASSSNNSNRGRKLPEIERWEALARIIITLLLIIIAAIFIYYQVAPDIGKVLLGAIAGYWLK